VRAWDALREAGNNKVFKRAVADNQYGSGKLRRSLASLSMEDIIPYPSNQYRGEKGLLRVDKKFRTHRPYSERLKYRKRISVEHVGARLRLHTAFDRLKTRGLRRVETHNLLNALCMNLVWEAAHNLGIPEKARSITYFNT